MSIDVRTQGWGRSCGLADHHLLDFNRWAKAVQPPRVPHGHVTRSVVASDSALYTPANCGNPPFGAVAIRI